ncbi:EamA family transporter [Lactobacillus sp.] [Lactiplantibacillus mudanjiangensis]|nr:hypothetical protein [Lactiplantibacillus mudanjiangensis]VDG31110.1 EamA family transporter [Lactobacillus sp.] [Lactiplantibacillus mudanjiangensis]
MIMTTAAMIVAAIGVFMVVTKGNVGRLFAGNQVLFATVLILLGALCWVIYTTGGADFADWSILRYSTLTTIYGVGSVIVILAIATSLGYLSVPSWSQISGVRLYDYLSRCRGSVCLESGQPFGNPN